jgi:hypothetical protein
MVHTSGAGQERVSPCVFRVVALPAPTEREESQMHSQLDPRGSPRVCPEPLAKVHVRPMGP